MPFPRGAPAQLHSSIPSVSLPQIITIGTFQKQLSANPGTISFGG